MYNRYSPGCTCCTSIDCRSLLYQAPFVDFALAQGTLQPGPYPGTGSFAPGSIAVADRWAMAPGQMLTAHDPLSPGAQAWYHTIVLDGDADIIWDGGTIAFRPALGTVTAGGHTGLLMPTDGTTTRHAITLYVTPDWYGVYVLPYHQTLRVSPPITPIIAPTRGSMQCIDRTSDPLQRSVTLQADSAVAVYHWRIADATVLVDDGVIAEMCYRPELPWSTEACYQAHQPHSLVALPNVGTYHQPAAITITASWLDATRNYECHDPGPPPASVPSVWSYDGPILSAIDMPWLDHLWSVGFSAGDHGLATGPGINGINGTPAFATAGLPCCPNVCGDRPFQQVGQADVVWCQPTVIWPAATPATPYPRPHIRHSIDSSMADPASPSAVALVPLGPTGHAPATLTYSWRLYDSYSMIPGWESATEGTYSVQWVTL